MFAFLHVNVIYALYIYACIYNLKLLAAFIIVIELRIKLKKKMQLLYCIIKKTSGNTSIALLP